MPFNKYSQCCANFRKRSSGKKDLAVFENMANGEEKLELRGKGEVYDNPDKPVSILVGGTMN